MSDFVSYKFYEVAEFISEKINLKEIELKQYISTDNMLPNLGGVSVIDKLPTTARCNSFRKNDILFSNIRTYFKKVWLADFNGGCSADVLVMRSKDETVLLTQYLYLIVCSDDFINFTIATSKGAKMPRGDKSAILGYELSIPSIEKQQKAVDIYLTFNQKIQLNNETNKTLENIAQAIFKSWFIDFDPVKAKANALAQGLDATTANRHAMQAISGKTETELKELEQTNPKAFTELKTTAELFPSEIGGNGVPVGWGIKSLDEIANYQNGLALQKYRPEKGDNDFLPVVKIKQLKQGYADGEEKASADIKPECIIDNGDVIFSWSGSLVVDFWCGGKAALNQHLFKVTSNDYPKWYYYLYTCHHLDEFIRIANDKAVTMGHIKREHLSQAKCVVPSKEWFEQSHYIGYLLDKLVSNRLENNKLAQVRDTLLPKLLGGDYDTMSS